MWILCNVPRAFAGNGGRLGEHHTRWDAEPSVYSEDPAKRRKGEMALNWYAMTTSEINPIGRGAAMPAEALAVATAKLCHQALTWFDRVRLRVPLHAAKQPPNECVPRRQGDAFRRLRSPRRLRLQP